MGVNIAMREKSLSRENIAEEMADVEIMLEQLNIIFGNKADVSEWKKIKLQRLEERMEKEC